MRSLQTGSSSTNCTSKASRRHDAVQRCSGAQHQQGGKARRSPASMRRRTSTSSSTPLVVRAFAPSTTSTSTSSGTGAPSATLLNAKQRLVLSWAGAGIYFWWQAGAMKYLAEHFDMRKCSMVGASAGSLLSVLAACGVPADLMIERAYAMSVQHNIWERPLGLVGIWGQLIEQWLDDLLPDNAHELCQGRVTVIVTTLPDMQQVGISEFSSKQDLINACMASSHVPFVLDLKPTRTCRGRQCLDGSFPDFFTGVNCDMLRYGPEEDPGVPAVVFDYFDDPRLNRQGRMDMLQVKSYSEIRRMYRIGYEYASRLHADGRFNHYELSELLLQGARGHMSEVLVPEGSTHTHTHSKQPAHATASTTLAPLSSSPSASTSPTAAAAVEVAPPPLSSALAQAGGMGLVLELHQDPGELAQGLQQPTPLPQRAAQALGKGRGPHQHLSAV